MVKPTSANPYDDQGPYRVLVRRSGWNGTFGHYLFRQTLKDAIRAARRWLVGQEFPAAVMIVDTRKPLDSACEYLAQAERGRFAKVQREEVVA